MQRNEELQEAIATIDIESWLDDQGVRYRSARGASGRQLNVKECPACGNANWKVYLNADTGLGNCFHGDCEARFNKWSFIRAQLGTDNRGAVDAIKTAAREQGWRPPKLTAAPDVEYEKLKLPTSHELPIQGRNIRYLQNRGITLEVCRYFGLRYCHEGKFWWKEEGKNRFQDYRRRVLVPIFDLDGNLVSFQGRDITGTADKKYLFPPGFSSTGSILYNGHNAIGAERVCAGEGVFDVAAIKMALDEDMALRDVVPIGTFGKHLSKGDEDSQLAKLMLLKERGLKQITFMFDGEPKAIAAGLDAALQCHGVGLVARLAILPAGKDPNEVAPKVVRDAFWQARVVTPSSAIELQLKYCA